VIDASPAAAEQLAPDPASDRPAVAQLGLIDGSVDASTSEFRVVLDDVAVCQLDDLVCCEQQVADGRRLAHYGIVTEITSRIEGAEWSSDSAEVAAGIIPGRPIRVATVRILRTCPELWMPPAPAARVKPAQGEDRKLALFCDQMDQRLAVGVDQSGQPVWVDWRFCNGEKGAHISITGVSGVATKTSYATFLLYQLLETEPGRRLLGASVANTRAIVFNVKGEDLLHLDAPNNRLDDHPDSRKQWEALGVAEPGPFASVEFFSPARIGQGGQIAPMSVSRPAGSMTTFGWTPREFIARGLLPFCFTAEDDRRTQIGMVENRVRVQLARHAYPLQGEPGAVVLAAAPDGTSFNFDRLVEQQRPAKPAGAGRVVRDFSDLVDAIVGYLDPDGVEYSAWSGRAADGTVAAFTRRLMALQPRLGHLVHAALKPVSLDAHVSVVDIHDLSDAAQRFAVGALLQQIYASKQGMGRDPLRIVVLDELNKFAPKSGHSPLSEILVDIAERGRSLGVLLWGCQQSALHIDPAIFRNAAVKVAGRLDASEAGEYRFLPPEMRDRAARFLPGTMVLDQPLIPAPLPVRFPFPGYATNVTEAASTARRPDAEIFDL
jgi:hypothetical protein